MQNSNSGSAERPVMNVGEKERILSALAGSMLIYALAKKHMGSTLLLLGGSYLLYRAVSGHCAVYDAVGARAARRGGDLRIRTHVVVNRPRAEVYAMWRRLENLPSFMRHLENVDELDSRTSAWRLKMPGGMGDVRWESRIVKEEKGVELSWNSVPGSAIRNTGKINFSDTPAKGTRVDVMLVYGVSPGPIGERMADLLTPAFRQRVEEDILHFSDYAETVDVKIK